MVISLKTLLGEDAARGQRDERGAVLVIGLFMALAVIAATWVVIGIGDAVLARDRAQEAADSAAFTNAVISARGMNVITFINIILMTLAIFYLFMIWIDVLISVLLTVSGIQDFDTWYNPANLTTWCGTREALTLFRVPACRVAKLQPFATRLYSFNRNQYFPLFKRVSKVLFEVQVWVAQVTPWLGTAAAGEAASEYGFPKTLSFGLSNYPGGGSLRPTNRLHLLDRIPRLNQTDREGRTVNALQDRRIGLPVEAEPAYQLCIRSTRFIAEWILQGLAQLRSVNGHSLSSWIRMEPSSTILYAAFQSGGEINRMLFCEGEGRPWTAPGEETPEQEAERLNGYRPPTFLRALGGGSREGLRLYFDLGLYGAKDDWNQKFYLKIDDFWRMEWPANRPERGYFAGPKRVSSYAYNGNDWMQIWTWTFVSPRDTAGRTVGMPARIFRRPAAVSGPGSKNYLAQSEFYLDCASVWQSSQCNKGSWALYNMSWRARLRRVHSLNLFGDLFELFLNNFVMGNYVKTWAKDRLGNLNPVIREGIIKALRNDLAKVLNHRIFTGDRSSNELLH